jgi:hypothetical protein
MVTEVTLSSSLCDSSCKRCALSLVDCTASNPSKHSWRSPATWRWTRPLHGSACYESSATFAGRPTPPAPHSKAEPTKPRPVAPGPVVCPGHCGDVVGAFGLQEPAHCLHPTPCAHAAPQLRRWQVSLRPGQLHRVGRLPLAPPLWRP